jgi:HSP20 family protein
MTMTRRPPQMADLETFREAIERMFDDRPFRPLWPWNGESQRAPALDLYTTNEAVIAKIALPGVKPEDIDVTIADDMVTVRASFKEEAEKAETAEPGFVHRELGRGSLMRTFVLPTAIRPDAATATFQDGLLTVTMPKIEEVKPRHVKVDVTG